MTIKKTPSVFMITTLFLYSSCILAMENKIDEELRNRKRNIEWKLNEENRLKKNLAKIEEEQENRKTFFSYISKESPYAEEIYKKYKENHPTLNGDKLKTFISEEKKEIRSASIRKAEEFIDSDLITEFAIYGGTGGAGVGGILSFIGSIIWIIGNMGPTNGAGDGVACVALGLGTVAGGIGGCAGEVVGGILGGGAGLITHALRSCCLDDKRKRKLAEYWVDLQNKKNK